MEEQAPRVEACIDGVMAKHPRITPGAQAQLNQENQ